jgi:hypothetical protein
MVWHLGVNGELLTEVDIGTVTNDVANIGTKCVFADLNGNAEQRHKIDRQ